MGARFQEGFIKTLQDSTMSHIKETPIYRIKQMAGFTYLLPSLLVVLILKETDALFDPCSELKREIDYVNKMNHRNELLLFQCQVSRKNIFLLRQ